MAFDNRHIFAGTINKQHLKDFFALDYSLKTYEERESVIDEMLEKVFDDYKRNFFQIYFDEYYKVNINNNDNLAERINVCKTLETMASYLLGCVEVREERKNNEIKYVFYVNREEFLLRTKKEINLSEVYAENNVTDIENNILHYLITNQKIIIKSRKNKRYSQVI